jgi:hypothetical protein
MTETPAGPLEKLVSEHPALASAVAVEPRPDPDTDPELARYVRSYLMMRVFIGALGVALPLMVVFVDWRLGGEPVPQDSLSAYYYSGARELFVGVLSAIAVFLFTYRVAERHLDNWLSLFAGVAVLAVVLFPTGRPAHVDDELTPFQDWAGESVVESIHFVAAAAFIGSLAVISLFFGVREGARPPRQGMRRSRRFWQRFHWLMASAIMAAVLMIAVASWTEWLPWEPRYWLLLGEWIAVWAFAASWLWKGLELDLLASDHVNHGLHLVLSIITLGVWVIVWAILVLRRRSARPSA